MNTKDNNPTASSSFLHHALIYGIGNILVYAGSFCLLPIYVSYLSEAEYGILDTLQRIGEILTLCLFYNGLRQALFAFHNQTDNEDERREVIGSILIVTASFFLVGGGLLLIFSRDLSELLTVGSVEIFQLAIVSVLLEAFSLLLLALAQARVESMFFVTISLLQFLCRSLLCIVLVAGFRMGIQGALLAALVTSSIFILVLFTREMRRGRLRFRPQLMKSLLWFALPFLPGGIGFFILNSGDRFFLLQHVSKTELGAYALGYKLALVVRLLARRPLYQVWSARMYRVAKQSDASRIFGLAFTRIQSVYVFVGLSVCILDREVLAILVGDRFQGALMILSPIVFAYFLLLSADSMDAGLYVTRQTKWKMLCTSVSTITTVSLYASLIPHLGTSGAVLATIIGFTAHVITTFIVTQRLFYVQYEWRRLLMVLGSAILVWSVCQLLPFSWWLVPVKISLLILWLTFLWQFNVVHEEEKAWGRAAFHKLVEHWERWTQRAHSSRRPDVQLEQPSHH